MCPGCGRRRHDRCASRARRTHRAIEGVRVRRVGRAEAQVDQPRLTRDRPLDGCDESNGRCRERAIEDLGREDLSVRRFFTNRRRDRGAVTQPVGVVCVEVATLVETCTIAHALHVRVGGVNAAVNHGDLDAGARGRQ